MDVMTFLFVFLGIDVFLILATHISHIFTRKYLNKFNGDVEKEKKYWIQTWGKIKNKREGVLNFIAVRNLKNPANLVAFNKFIHEISDEDRALIFEKNKTRIFTDAKKMEPMLKAYFVYFIDDIKIGEFLSGREHLDFLVSCVTEKSVHLRENALKALYHAGDASSIKSAFLNLSEQNIFHSDKLLADGMLEYSGDKADLATMLMDSYSNYSDCYKVAVVSFLYRDNNHKYDYALIEELNNDRGSMDVLCQIIRLIGNNPTHENENYLIQYFRNHDEEKYWECLAVIANVLGSFEKNAEIVDVLISALCYRNWYIRTNSANSLSRIGVSDDEIERVKETNDSYALDALEYALSRG